MESTPDYLWWIEHAHTDSALLTLMKSHEYFVHLVETRARKLGRDDVQDVVNEATYRACFEPDRFASMWSILNGIAPALHDEEGETADGKEADRRL